jgi:hypothetical protein
VVRVCTNATTVGRPRLVVGGERSHHPASRALPLSRAHQDQAGMVSSFGLLPATVPSTLQRQCQRLREDSLVRHQELGMNRCRAAAANVDRSPKCCLLATAGDSSSLHPVRFLLKEQQGQRHSQAWKISSRTRRARPSRYTGRSRGRPTPSGARGPPQPWRARRCRPSGEARSGPAVGGAVPRSLPAERRG